MLDFLLFLQANPPTPPQWYEQVSGILAIPITLVGGAYSYVLIKKTRLETIKTELEIREKQLALEEKEHAGVAHPASVPLAAFTFGNLLLRFVVLELILRFSAALTLPLKSLFSGLAYAIYWAIPSKPTEFIAAALLQFGMNELPSSLLYWALLFTLGWPLFKDTLKALGIATKDLSVRAVLDSFRGARD